VHRKRGSLVRLAASWTATKIEPHKRKVLLLKPEYPSYFVCGSRGSGKSVLLEFFLEWYYSHNYVILDWFGSFDQENAFWCIPDLTKVFSWRMVPGKQEDKFRKYLSTRFGMKWVLEAAVEKSGNGKIIYVDGGRNLLALKLTKKDNRADLYLSDGNSPSGFRKPWEFVVKEISTKDGERVKAVFDINPTRTDWHRVRKYGYPVLVIMPKTTIVKPVNPICVCGFPLQDHEGGHFCDSPSPLIKTVNDDTPLKDILVMAHRERRICIFNRGFYVDQKDAYRRLAKMLNELPYLVIKKAVPSEISLALGMRELGNIAPSGLKGMVGNYETNTKREIQTLIREARHVRTVMIGDFQRSSDIARSISAQRDFIIFKRSTRDLIPEDYEWLYDKIENERAQAAYLGEWGRHVSLVSISQLKHWQSYIVFPDRHYELRSHMMASFRHKRPHDNWAELADCDIEYQDKKTGLDNLEKSIKTKQEKLEKKKEKIEKLKEAVRMHTDGLKWEDIAKKLGWINKKTSKPSPAALQMDIKRHREKGLLA